MKWGKDRTVTLRSIIAPGDVKRRQATGEVVELAATIGEFGDQPINPPTVMKVRKGWQLIAGRDRVSALLLVGIKTTPVRVVDEATPQELHDMEVVENLNRRVDDRNKLIAERSRKVAENIAAKRAQAGTVVPPTQRDKADARKAVAASLGVQPATVKKAELRARVREEQAAGNLDVGGRVEEPSPAPIETYGNALPDEVRDYAVDTIAAMREVESALGKALRALPETAHGSLQIRSDIEHALRSVRSLGVTHLCPYCKGVKPDCDPCRGRGAVCRGTFESAPAELRGLSAVTDAPSKKPRGVRVVIVDDQGAEHDVTDAPPMNSDDERPDVEEEDLAF